MKDFVILFRQGPRTLNPDDLARRQQEVAAWARRHNQAGRQLEPRILAPEVLRPGPALPGSPDAWPVTALLFLKADSLADAASVAESHPGHHFGASVEVRPWAAPGAAAPPPRPAQAR